ncbi:unnamed protein product [Nippostrongylus brasiliensis]|uniref:Val_tRNA-synt_C domain-containing protein n=1 Tax=Nippostrongylus brasiliensis TaxID=27835 RepID=A0A0N4YWC6_NIPBR|nr:unnamed protein product [Nippostrongylus brasiliensis]
MPNPPYRLKPLLRIVLKVKAFGLEEAVFQPNAAITPQEQMQKKIDKMKLKLTEIEKLEERINSGEIIPLPNQVAKVGRKSEIESEIEKLTEEMNKL